MKLHTIRHGDWEAVIKLSRGANCVALRHAALGARLLREPSFAEGEHPFLFGMPILFPVNRLSGGGFVFEGREYRFPVNEPETGCHLHGGIHAMPFEVTESGVDFVTCVYRADHEHPYGAFPHAFEIRIAYRLDDTGMEQVSEVINRSDRNMPCLIGFHTTFRVPFIEGGEARVMADVCEEYARGADYLPTGQTPAPDEVIRALRAGTFDPLSRPISRHCRAGESGIMAIEDARHGVRMVYENSASLGFRLIYNGEANGFICLEPQNCLVDAPNNVFGRERSGFDAIAPGEKRIYRSRISLEHI